MKGRVASASASAVSVSRGTGTNTSTLCNLSLFLSGSFLLLAPRARSLTTTTSSSPLLVHARRRVQQQHQQQQQQLLLLRQGGGGFHQRPSSWFLSSSDSSAATDSAVSSLLSSPCNKLLPIGGDFAGLSATYNLDGSLIPIPEYWIPESLLEWGQEPSCLEVLVSEEFHDTNNKRGGQRQTVTVLPAIGCAVDNMETTKTVQDFFWDDDDADHESFVLSKDQSVLALSFVPRDNNRNKKNHRIMLEAAFGLADDCYGSSNREQRDERDHPLQHSRDESPRDHREMMMRVRVSVACNTQTLQLVPPVTIAYERQISTTSSRGSVADGGGLDGRSVARMLGEGLRRSYDLFEKTITPAPATTTTPPASSSSSDAGNKNHQPPDGNNMDVDAVAEAVVRFPCDITIRSLRTTSSSINTAAASQLVVEIGHTTSMQERNGGEGGVRRMKIVQASFLRKTSTKPGDADDDDYNFAIKFDSRVDAM